MAVQDGRVWTWGDNSHGQLGQPDASRTLRPRPVVGLTGVVAVAASWHSLALTMDGRVHAWGRNTTGQLGNGRFGLAEMEPLPVLVEGFEQPVAAIATGWDHSLALARDGSVYTWGCRSHGQLGDGVRETGSPVATPRRVPGLSGVVAIAAGGQHSLALLSDGTLMTWGSNWNGQLGNGKLGAGTHSALPRPVVGPDGKGKLGRVTAIAGGGLHSLAVTGDGKLYAWGYNGTGQLGDGARGGFWEDGGKRNLPSPVTALWDVKEHSLVTAARAVSAGFEASYFLSQSGGAGAAGWSMYGELGVGSIGGGNRDTFGPVRSGRQLTGKLPRPGTWHASLVYRYTDRGHLKEGVKDLEVEDRFDGPPLLVSEGAAGGARSGTVERRAGNVETQAALVYPAQAEAGKPFAILLTRLMFGSHEGDDDFATAVRLCWTHGETGESVEFPLGIGERAGGSVLPALGGLAAVAAGPHHVVARDQASRLWAWGHNGFGQLGDGSVNDCSVAQQLAPFDEGVRPIPPEAKAPAESDAVAPSPGCLNVRELGATGNGIDDDQRALQRAIDRCAEQGGGIVWLPPGSYCTGTIELRDHVRLHLSRGATILASMNREHYPVKALIHAAGVENVAITGEGIIDGRGTFTGARDWRHYVVLTENCGNVRIEGVSTVNSGSWTQHHIRCVGLSIRRVTVRSLLPGRNNDGIDLSGCEDVKIEGCTVISDDDAIVIKSQLAERVNRNIEVVGNVCHTYRGAFKLGTETRGVYENIACRDLTCYGAKALELYSVDGSESSGISAERIRAHDALVALNIRLGARLRPNYWAKGLQPRPGHLRGIRIRDLEATVSSRGWREILLEHGIPGAEWATARPESAYDACISGLPGHPVEDVLIEGVRVRVPGGVEAAPTAEDIPERPEVYPHAGNFGVLPAHGLFVRHASRVTIRKAVFETGRPDARPPVSAIDAEGLVVE